MNIIFKRNKDWDTELRERSAERSAGFDARFRKQRSRNNTIMLVSLALIVMFLTAEKKLSRMAQKKGLADSLASQLQEIPLEDGVHLVPGPVVESVKKAAVIETLWVDPEKGGAGSGTAVGAAIVSHSSYAGVPVILDLREERAVILVPKSDAGEFSRSRFFLRPNRQVSRIHDGEETVLEWR